MMNCFLIGLGFFAISWIPNYVRTLIWNIRYKQAKKNAKKEDKWMFA